jgi:hypothetical protein
MNLSQMARIAGAAGNSAADRRLPDEAIAGMITMAIGARPGDQVLEQYTPLSWLRAGAGTGRASRYADTGGDELLSTHRYYCEEYGPALGDNLRNAAGRFVAGLMPEDRLPDFKELISEYIYRQLREISLIKYLAMKKRNDFSPYGENRVALGICRNIFHIPSHRSVDFLEYFTLGSVLDECDRRNGSRTGKEYSGFLKKFKLEFLGKRLDEKTVRELTDLIAPRVYFNSKALYGDSFIFGLEERRDRGKVKVSVIQEEYARSPEEILGLAARVNGENALIIRQESCDVIFNSKWLDFFKVAAYGRHPGRESDAELIREGFKKNALLSYGAVAARDMLRIRPAFIEDMLDGIYFHERGHDIADGFMTQRHRGVAAWFRKDDMNGPVYALEEAMADWAPDSPEKGKGAMGRFAEFALIDENRGARCLYAYCSDCWFISHKEKGRLAHASLVMVGLALGFITDSGRINTERLMREKEAVWDSLINRRRRLLNELLDILYSAVFRIQGYEFTYQELEKTLFAVFYAENAEETLESMEKNWDYWNTALNCLKFFSRESWKRCRRLQQAEKIALEQMVLDRASEGRGGEYRNDLCRFIAAKCRRIGAWGK